MSWCPAQPIFLKACMPPPTARSTSAASAGAESGVRSRARPKRASGSSRARTAWIRPSACWRTTSRTHSMCARTTSRRQASSCRPAPPRRRSSCLTSRPARPKAASHCRDRRPCAMTSGWPAMEPLTSRIPLPAISYASSLGRRSSRSGRMTRDGMSLASRNWTASPFFPTARSTPTFSKATGYIALRLTPTAARGRSPNCKPRARSTTPTGCGRSAPISS